MSEFLTTTVTAATKAGAYIKQQYSKKQQISFKDQSRLQIVTETDIGAEKIVLDTITQAHPDHAYFSEEAGSSANRSEYLWTIDPLDGTTNFTQGIDHFCVSIALQHKGQRIVGVVYNPINNQLFSWATNQPSLLNKSPISVNTKADLKQCIVSFNRSSNEKAIARYGKGMAAIAQRTRTPRVFGSVALDLSYVAAGKLDAFVGYEINHHDAAAAISIAENAGAIATTFNNQPWQPGPNESADLLVANQVLHPQFLELISQTE